MATATFVNKVREVVEREVVLELTEEEATFLRSLVGNLPAWNNEFSSIFDALHDLGFRSEYRFKRRDGEALDFITFEKKEDDNG